MRQSTNRQTRYCYPHYTKAHAQESDSSVLVNFILSKKFSSKNTKFAAGLPPLRKYLFYTAWANSRLSFYRCSTRIQSSSSWYANFAPRSLQINCCPHFLTHDGCCRKLLNFLPITSVTADRGLTIHWSTLFTVRFSSVHVVNEPMSSSVGEWRMMSVVTGCVESVSRQGVQDTICSPWTTRRCSYNMHTRVQSNLM